MQNQMQDQMQNQMQTPEQKLSAVIYTEKGPIHCVLHADLAPLTVANFVNLARRKFYNNLVFHRTIKKPPFVTQGGCPEGDGTGTPGYRFEDEICEQLNHNRVGVLSMVNMGKDHNGSQFFFNLTPTPWLNGHHSVFGETVGEDDVAIMNLLEKNDRILDVSIEGDYRPLLERFQARILQWNETIDRYFPTLPPAS